MAFSQSYILTAITWLLQAFWSDGTGRIVLLTVISYFLGYSVYIGYLSRFTGGFSSISLGRIGFQITDLITLLPTAIVTMLSIIKQEAVRFLVWLLIFVIAEGLVLFFGVALGLLLQTIGWSASGLVAYIAILVFSLGFSVSLWTLYPRQKNILFTIVPLVLQLIGIAISFSGAIALVSFNPQQSVLGTSLPQLFGIIISEIFVLLIIVSILLLPVILGVRLGTSALEGKTLSKIEALTLQAQIPQLVEFRSVMRPDIFTYRFAQQHTTAFLIDAFSGRTGVYLLKNGSPHKEGRLIIIKDDLIQAIELHPTNETP